MKVLIDKVTNTVVGVNAPSTPLTIEVQVPEGFTLSKTMIVQEGEVPKTNDNGETLYLKEVFRSEETVTVVGIDETIENTGRPILERVQKTNAKGEPLCLEPIVDSEGNVVDYMETTKAVDDSGQWDLAPVMIEIQKTSVSGKPLYWKDITETTYENVFDHMEESTEGEGLEPIMVPNMVPKLYTLEANPDMFTLEEVLEAKYQELLSASDYNYILADMFLNEDDIDLADENHSANTGIALLQLLPYGQAKTKLIELEEPSHTFKILELNCDSGVEVYINGVKFTEGKLMLDSKAESCTVEFKNTSNRPKQIYSYAIAY